jgi:hypothetical protein
MIKDVIRGKNKELATGFFSDSSVFSYYKYLTTSVGGPRDVGWGKDSWFLESHTNR